MSDPLDHRETEPTAAIRASADSKARAELQTPFPKLRMTEESA